LRRLFFD